MLSIVYVVGSFMVYLVSKQVEILLDLSATNFLQL